MTLEATRCMRLGSLVLASRHINIVHGAATIRPFIQPSFLSSQATITNRLYRRRYRAPIASSTASPAAVDWPVSRIIW